ncbi:MAG: isocitrate/isopropylmalate dehydrogenase family protein [Elusimicrobia bacterium]|nr:isocitrate/isopropylmalate dehydrogenase family protein [Candidatus Obscuribacterium magneticum]
MTNQHIVTLIPGDGTGPEIVKVVKDVLAGIGANIRWEEVDAGESAVAKHGTPLPEAVLQSIRKNKVALKGPLTTPVATGFRSVNVALRKELDLYACVRPCKSFNGIKSPYTNIDLVFVRENTEDVYSGIEYPNNSKEAQQIISWAKNKIFPDANITIKPISVTGSKRIAIFAFEYALKNKRRKVTAVTKANIMKLTDGLFLEVCRDVAKKYPTVEYDERLVDNMCMQLVIKPELYDVLLLPNLYGDIMSDMGAGLVGGLGVAPGANLGNGMALFEAVHGSAPKYKGQNKINPTALLLSAKLMLDYLGEKAVGQRLEQAIQNVIAEGKHITYDLGGRAGTSEMGEAIVKAYHTLDLSSLPG